MSKQREMPWDNKEETDLVGRVIGLEIELNKCRELLKRIVIDKDYLAREEAKELLKNAKNIS